jgi:hypothetical protein
MPGTSKSPSVLRAKPSWIGVQTRLELRRVLTGVIAMLRASIQVQMAQAIGVLDTVNGWR